MRTYISQKKLNEREIAFKIALVKGRKPTIIIGRTTATIFSEYSYLVISRPNIVNTAVHDNLKALMLLLKAAEGQAFIHKCAEIYGAAYSDDEKAAFVKNGFKLCDYRFKTEDTDNALTCWYGKKSTSIRPMVLVVYTNGKFSSLHTAYRKIRNPDPA
ncbi:MAG: hypothetical protein ABTQ34_01175 [Bdellovibrionales bacterium]